MPFSIKDKIREHFDESLKVFKRKGQAIWNTHKENALVPKQVKYDRLQQREQNHYKPKMNYHKRVCPNNQQNFHLRDTVTSRLFTHIVSKEKVRKDTRDRKETRGTKYTYYNGCFLILLLVKSRLRTFPLLTICLLNL